MGKKVDPNGYRLGVIRDWGSKWFANARDFGDLLLSDMKIRDFLNKKLAQAALAGIDIARAGDSVIVTLRTARPGIIIGRKGEDVDKLRAEVSKIIGGIPVQINISEIRKPELEAKLVADNVAQQIERRIMFRRAMKRAVTSTMRAGAQGVKIRVGGRLGGAEIARTEWYREGRVPLHTLRADVDYGTARAKTTYGIIGVKVWIFKGEIYAPEDQLVEEV